MDNFIFEIERNKALKQLNDSFTTKPGLYVLIWKPGRKQEFEVYVGECENIRTRHGSHRRSTDRSGWTMSYVFVGSDAYPLHITLRRALEHKTISLMRSHLREPQKSNIPAAPVCIINEVDGLFLSIKKVLVDRLGLVTDDNSSSDHDASDVSYIGSGTIEPEKLNLITQPKSRFIARLDALEELSSRKYSKLFEELLDFCLSLRGTEISRRKNKDWPVFAMQVGGKNYCMFNAKPKHLSLDLQHGPRTRTASCLPGTDADPDRWCSHHADNTRELKEHIAAAHRNVTIR